MRRLPANYRGMPAAKYNARSVTVVEGAIPYGVGADAPGAQSSIPGKQGGEGGGVCPGSVIESDMDVLIPDVYGRKEPVLVTGLHVQVLEQPVDHDSMLACAS